MKNFLIKSAALAALTVISAVSCTKEQNVDASVSQPELHFIIKTAENTPVKSFIENNLDKTYTPKWTEGDELAIFIGDITNSTTAPTATLPNIEKTGLIAKFDGTVSTDKKEGSFLSFSPAGAFAKGYTDGTVGINLSNIQTPSSLTIDEACDVLVAKPCDFTAENGTVKIDDLFFKRIFSVVKVNLNGADALNGEKVTSFTLNAPVTLTGCAAVDLSTASFSKWNVENKSVTANYSEDWPVFGGVNGLENTIWLVVNPTTVANGSTVTFSGETENYTFSKEVKLSEDLVFPQSQIAVINLTIGEGNYTAKKKTVTYTVTSTSAVLVSGDAPSGSNATFSNTYTKNKNQLTSGQSMTLTLSGYQGMTVKGLTLSMKSNSDKGAGYLSVMAGKTTLGSIGSSRSGVKFNTASWYGDWSTSYVDVKPTLSNTAYTVQNGENIVIVIGATTNSLYCQSFTIEYVADPSYVPGAVKLAAPKVSCSAKTETSLTFSWTADANASDYKVSTDGGITYVSTQTETSYIWTGLEANTSHTLYVKAIGDGTAYTDSEVATATGTTTAGSGSGENPGVTTVSLDETEIKALGELAYTDLKTINDGKVTWTVHAYKETETRPYLQLKKDSGVYVKISAPSAIKEVRLTITSTTNSKGGVEDISKHSAYSSSGTISLKSADAAGNTTTNDVVSCTGDAISNNDVTLVPNGSYTDLYLKVSAGARIWGIEVDY